MKMVGKVSRETLVLMLQHVSSRVAGLCDAVAVSISENAERANPYDLNPYDPRCIPKFVKFLNNLTILTKFILKFDNLVISI